MAAMSLSRACVAGITLLRRRPEQFVSARGDLLNEWQPFAVIRKLWAYIWTENGDEEEWVLRLKDSFRRWWLTSLWYGAAGMLYWGVLWLQRRS